MERIQLTYRQGGTTEYWVALEANGTVTVTQENDGYRYVNNGPERQSENYSWAEFEKAYDGHYLLVRSGYAKPLALFRQHHFETLKTAMMLGQQSKAVDQYQVAVDEIDKQMVDILFV